MTDIADDIKAAVNSGRARTNPNLAGFAERTTMEGNAEGQTFLKYRADLHGALIEAHRRIGNGTPWTPVDDHILDVLRTWADNVNGRKVR
jgi:hypothetical protein